MESFESQPLIVSPGDNVTFAWHASYGAWLGATPSAALWYGEVSDTGDASKLPLLFSTVDAHLEEDPGEVRCVYESDRTLRCVDSTKPDAPVVWQTAVPSGEHVFTLRSCALGLDEDDQSTLRARCDAATTSLRFRD